MGGYRELTPEEKAAWDKAKSQGTYYGDRDNLISQEGWYAADQGLLDHGSYRDPRVAAYDPWAKQGMPAWGDKERLGVMQRTQGARARQGGAFDILAGQSRETPAAQRIGAYKQDKALQAGAGTVGAAGTPAEQRAAMLGYGEKAGAAGGQSMAKSADERMRGISTTTQAGDRALRGYTAAAKEGMQYQALSLQDKWNRMKALTDYEKQQLQVELMRSKAKGQITQQELNMILGLVGSGSSAIGAVAAGSSGGSSSASSGSSAGSGGGYQDIDDIVDDVFPDDGER